MQLTKDTLHYLLETTVIHLKSMPCGVLKQHQGADFEPILKTAIDACIDQLGMRNGVTVEHVSGHRFPDIVIHTPTERLGIEVKTAKSKGWTTLGGSIFESTRIEGIKDIMLFFASFSTPESPMFRFAWMETCISDVLITHKPRYAINMDITETFFDHSGVSYQQLQEADKPFALIRGYLKQRNGQHADLWWVDDGDDHEITTVGPQSIKTFSAITKVEQEKIAAELCVLFPEILSNSSKKYERASLFLVSKKGLVHSSLRDLFSASGQYHFQQHSVPKYLARFLEYDQLKNIIKMCSAIDVRYLDEYWDNYDPSLSRHQQWQDAIFSQIKQNPNIPAAMTDDIIAYLTAQIQSLTPTDVPT